MSGPNRFSILFDKGNTDKSNKQANQTSKQRYVLPEDFGEVVIVVVDFLV